MKSYLRILGVPVIIGLLMLLSLVPSAGAAGAAKPVRLQLKPYSGGLLMAQAIHSGSVKLTAHHSQGSSIGPDLYCNPAPCVMLNHQASEGGQPANETPIAANPNNGKELLTGANDYNCPNLQGFYASTNGGKTWNVTCMSTYANGFGEGDPGVGYDLQGNAYISGIEGGTPDGSDIIFEKSSDGGTTWSAPAAAVPAFFSGGLTDKPWLWVDDNANSPHASALYISVTQFDSSNNTTITVSHSNDGGNTWTTVPVDSTQLYPTIDQFSDIVTAKDGTVYTTWMRCVANGPSGDCGGTTASMMMSKSTDGGNTWSTPAVIATTNLAPDNCGAFYGCLPNTFERVSNIPVIGSDNSSGKHAGNLYTVYYNWTGTYMQVVVVTSTDGGATWGSPVAVAPSTDTHDQFFPWLSVSNSGVVGVTWLDRRNDPNNVNYQAFSATSMSGGKGFTDSFITHVQSNPFNDGFGGGFMGDYSGNVWAGNHLYASWSDTRNGTDCQDEVGGRII